MPERLAKMAQRGDRVVGVSLDEVERSLTEAVNRVSAENGSNTADFILGRFLAGVLAALDEAVKRRDAWYGVELAPGQSRRAERLSNLRAAEAVFATVGRAAGCWSHASGRPGVFDADAAAECAEDLLREFGYEVPARYRSLGVDRMVDFAAHGQPVSTVRRPGSEDATRMVFEALGSASMCWENPRGAGVFDSDRAAQIGRALLEALGFEVPPGYRVAPAAEGGS